jgi:FkbM family methyltransferase
MCGLLGLWGFLKITLLERTGTAPRSLTRLKLRPLHSGPVLLRAGTSDYPTLRTTFLQQYHLPHARLGERATILDLGCNVGYTVLHFAHEYPDARVFGVEMDRDNFDLARTNTEGQTNITLLHRAVSISNGTVSYNKTAPEDAYHINRGPAGAADQETTVEAMTIGSLLQELGIEHVDYLKMDIEGEEVRVLNEDLGDLSWLKMVDMLNIEVHTGPEDLAQILSVLRSHDFVAWKESLHWSCIRAVKAEGASRGPRDRSQAASSGMMRSLNTVHETDSSPLAQ